MNDVWTEKANCTMLQVVRKNSGPPTTTVAVRSWMDSYRAAWEDLDRTELTRLFALKTHVSVDPFDRPVGYEQLATLWDDLAARQCENFLEFDIIKVFEQRAYVLWRCLTTNPVSRIRRQGYGVFALAFEGTACTEKLEWSKWPKNAGDAPPIPVNKVRSLTRHIDQRLGDRITISRLADMYKLSSRHATRLFRIFAGLPIHQYVVRQRLIRARERLAWGDERIVDIAYDLGFANQAHFISLFKQSTAFTPAQYRSRFSQAERGPVHRWVEDFRQLILDGDHLRLASELNMPAKLKASLRQRTMGQWLDGLAVEVLADTPSTALVHWRLPRLPEGSAGDGIVILKFMPDGRCYGKEDYFHWQ